MAAWRRQQILEFLPPPATGGLEPVSAIAKRVLRDMVIDVGSLASSARAPGLAGVLAKPLPFDSANPGKPALMPELMPATKGRLTDAAWDAVKTAFTMPPHSTPIVLVTGVSGMGKTKVACTRS